MLTRHGPPVVEVRLTVGIAGDAHEFGHRNGAALDHLHLVRRVHSKVRGEMRGPRRRQLRHLGCESTALPKANDPATSDPADGLPDNAFHIKIARASPRGDRPNPTAVSHRAQISRRYRADVGKGKPRCSFGGF